MSFSNLIKQSFSKEEQIALGKIGKFLLKKYFEPHFINNDKNQRIHLKIGVSEDDIKRLCNMSIDAVHQLMLNLESKNFGCIRKENLYVVVMDNGNMDNVKSNETWIIDLNYNVLFDELFIPIIDTIQV